MVGEKQFLGDLLKSTVTVLFYEHVLQFTFTLTLAATFTTYKTDATRPARRPVSSARPKPLRLERPVSPDLGRWRVSCTLPPSLSLLLIWPSFCRR